MRQGVERLGVVRVDGEGVGQRLFSLAGLGHLLVETGQIPHTDGRHQLVAFFHLGHAPVERVRGVLHVGHHRREQVRDAFVHRQFEHLRVDHDQPHLVGLALVEQRQDHGVDTHRLAGTGRARHQQVRHLAQIGHHRVAGNILAQADGQRRVHIVIGLGAENLRQAHGLALGVGQLERHARLARHGFDHPDRDQRQRARQILGQIDHLRTLHADRRFKFVTGDDRARIGGDHLHLDAKVGQFLLDEARGEFQRFGTRWRDILRGFVKQRHWRQTAIAVRTKQILLTLFLHTLGGRDHGHGRFDTHRRRGRALRLFAACFHHCLALLRQLTARATIPPGLATALQRQPGLLKPQAEALGRRQPRNTGKQAQATGDQGQQHQCAAGKTKIAQGGGAELRPQQTARRQRQARTGGMKAQGFERRTGEQDHKEARHHDEEGALVGIELVAKATEAPGNAIAEEDHQPPGRSAKQIEQHIGQPRAKTPAGIGHPRHFGGMRPARIGLVIAEQNHRHINGDDAQHNPAGFLKQMGNTLRQRLIAGTGLRRRRHGGAHTRCATQRPEDTAALYENGPPFAAGHETKRNGA